VVSVNHWLEKQRDDTLSQAEQGKLENSFQQSERYMLRKAYTLLC